MVLALEAPIGASIDGDAAMLPWLIIFTGVPISRFQLGPVDEPIMSASAEEHQKTNGKLWGLRFLDAT